MEGLGQSEVERLEQSQVAHPIHGGPHTVVRFLPTTFRDSPRPPGGGKSSSGTGGAQGGLRLQKRFFFAGAQGCGRLGDSFLWEGSLFVFQYVGGDGRGHILAQGPQLKISSFGKEKEELKK